MGFVFGADFDVDGIGVETGVVLVVVAFKAGDAHFFVFVQGVLGGGRGGAGLSGFGVDGYFGGYGAEGVFVEGIEEWAECVAVAPDFAEGKAVDCKGGDEGDPVDFKFEGGFKCSVCTNQTIPYKVAMRRKSHSDWIQHQSCWVYQQSHRSAAWRTHNSWTINPSPALIFEEEICQCGYEGEAVSCNKVLPFLSLHALSGPAAKQS